MTGTSGSDLRSIEQELQSAARILNKALRRAAEVDLRAVVRVYRQDLQTDLDVAEDTAPAVEVTITRR
jgi:hypothetical protein